jgi:hypothetical protein
MNKHKKYFLYSVTTIKLTFTEAKMALHKKILLGDKSDCIKSI